MIKIKLDGVVISVQSGQTILDIARSRGIFIPTLCHYKNNGGHCRICIVEVNGRLLPACTTYVQDGMVVTTMSDKIIASRKNTVKMIMKGHYVDCPNCNKCDNCELQDCVYLFDIKFNLNYQINTQNILQNINNEYQFNAGKCIFCMRCINALKERCTHNISTKDIYKSLCDNEKMVCEQICDICPAGAIVKKEAV